MPAEAVVKRFGRNGLHLIVRKRDGFKEGQKVLVLTEEEAKQLKKNQEDKLRKEIRNILEEELDEMLEERLQAIFSRARGF